MFETDGKPRALPRYRCGFSKTSCNRWRAACTVDSDGQPLHSWRTLILPYLDQQQLYESIDLSKPWNDPVNTEARSARISRYSCPSADGPAGHTTYMAMVGPRCAFRAAPQQLREITDGPSNTVLVIDASPAQSVHWMEPADSATAFFLKFGEKSDLSHSGGIQSVLADGTVRFLPATLPGKTRQAMSTIAGGENISEDD
ncbi:MAG: DUF1559 domain-containing protein [Planctomycetes bacterium]|nr:DUF1559 domain-containing protein [Planctomycetota bacterium]